MKDLEHRDEYRWARKPGYWYDVDNYTTDFNKLSDEAKAELMQIAKSQGNEPIEEDNPFNVEARDGKPTIFVDAGDPDSGVYYLGDEETYHYVRYATKLVNFKMRNNKWDNFFPEGKQMNLAENYKRLFKEDLNNLIQEDALDLSIGQTYSVLEPGMGDWVDDMKYIGYDSNEKWYVFQSDKQMDEEFFMYIPKGEEDNISDVV